MHPKTLASVLLAVALSAGAAAPEITISSPAGSVSTVIGVTHAAADESLLQKVVSALSSDPDLRGAFVTVTVEGGAVKLTGTANTAVQAARAEEVAQAAAGSTAVVSEVRTGG